MCRNVKIRIVKSEKGKGTVEESLKSKLKRWSRVDIVVNLADYNIDKDTCRHACVEGIVDLEGIYLKVDTTLILWYLCNNCNTLYYRVLS